ncbi:hypothetical protein B566_EDAN008986 [Ephemera danica]|nr:hypothetical protein B566_EDAN008986 [Ephemera danica]
MKQPIINDGRIRNEKLTQCLHAIVNIGHTTDHVFLPQIYCWYQGWMYGVPTFFTTLMYSYGFTTRLESICASTCQQQWRGLELDRHSGTGIFVERFGVNMFLTLRPWDGDRRRNFPCSQSLSLTTFTLEIKARRKGQQRPCLADTARCLTAPLGSAPEGLHLDERRPAISRQPPGCLSRVKKDTGNFFHPSQLLGSHFSFFFVLQNLRCFQLVATAGIESYRILEGQKGNLISPQGKVSIVVSMGLCAPSVLAVLYFVLWQHYVLRLEFTFHFFFFLPLLLEVEGPAMESSLKLSEVSSVSISSCVSLIDLPELFLIPRVKAVNVASVCASEEVEGVEVVPGDSLHLSRHGELQECVIQHCFFVSFCLDFLLFAGFTAQLERWLQTVDNVDVPNVNDRGHGTYSYQVSGGRLSGFVVQPGEA